MCIIYYARVAVLRVVYVLWGGGRVILCIACVAIYALWSGGRMIICILVWLLCVWCIMEW